MIDWGTILSNKTKVKAVKKFAHSEGTGENYPQVLQILMGVEKFVHYFVLTV